jgi:hypothetical protein
MTRNRPAKQQLVLRSLVGNRATANKPGDERKQQEERWAMLMQTQQKVYSRPQETMCIMTTLASGCQQQAVESSRLVCKRGSLQFTSLRPSHVLTLSV